MHYQISPEMWKLLWFESEKTKAKTQTLKENNMNHSIYSESSSLGDRALYVRNI